MLISSCYYVFMHQNLYHGRFKKSIAGKLPFTLMEELLARVEMYVCIGKTMGVTTTAKRKQQEEEHADERKK